MAKLKSQNDVITEFYIKHGSKYDYSKFKYINTRTKSTIICTTHGEFQQTPRNHLKGQGCVKCSYIGGRTPIDTNFIGESNVVHCDKYDYSKVEYVNNKTKVVIICPEHGEFEQRPDMHKHGQGCPKCANLKRGGRYDDMTIVERLAIKEVFLYHIRVSGNGEVFDKIGITVNPNRRFYIIGHQTGYSVEVVDLVKCDNAELAYRRERELLRLYADNKYHPTVNFNGVTECFSEIILDMLNQFN